MRRRFAIDVLRGTHCGGRLRLLAAITDKATARKILEHLGPPRTELRDADGPKPRALAGPTAGAPPSVAPPTATAAPTTVAPSASASASAAPRASASPSGSASSGPAKRPKR